MIPERRRKMDEADRKKVNIAVAKQIAKLSEQFDTLAGDVMTIQRRLESFVKKDRQSPFPALDNERIAAMVGHLVIAKEWWELYLQDTMIEYGDDD
jgi:hypothetical protein